MQFDVIRIKEIIQIVTSSFLLCCNIFTFFSMANDLGIPAENIMYICILLHNDHLDKVSKCTFNLNNAVGKHQSSSTIFITIYGDRCVKI